MSRYSNNPLILFTEASGNKTFPIQRSVRYSELPHDVNDIYVYTTLGDRLDSQNSLFVPVGTEIRIPYNISLAKTLFNTINRI